MKSIFTSAITILCLTTNLLLNAQSNTIILTEMWVNNNWEQTEKETLIVYGTDLKTQSLIQNYDAQTASWINSNKTDYTYNINNKINTELATNWSQALNSFTNNTRTSYTYNSTQSVSIMISEEFRNNSWSVVSKENYTYDANNYPISSLTQTKDRTTNLLKDTLKNMVTNNANGLPVQVVLQKFENGQWVNTGRVNLTYTNTNLESTVIIETWSNNAWVNEIKITNTYIGANKTESLQTIEAWVNSNWMLVQEINNAFDLNNRLSQAITKTLNNPATPLENFLRRTYSYEQNLNVYEENASNYKLYPNPTTDAFNIVQNAKQFNKVNIYSISGALMMQQDVNTVNEKIDISNLSKGIYFINLIGGKSKVQQKIIKE